MKLGVYAVLDKAGGFFLQPFFIENNTLALRMIRECVRDEEHQFSKFYEDMGLYRIGTYDTLSGEIESDISLLCQLRALVKPEDSNNE